MLKIFNKNNAYKMHHVLKYTFVSVIGLAVIYSFAAAPIMDKYKRKACHQTSMANAQQVQAQVEQANSQLQEGEQPMQVDQIGIYNTQYMLCLRSKGL